MEDNKKNKTTKKVTKRTKSAKTTKTESGNKPTKGSSRINDGKCCRCSFRNYEKKCSNKKSASHGKYVARKSGCDNFKYAN